MLVRDGWAHLNGLWEIDTAAANLATPPFGKTLPDEILVPYPVESPLSGIRRLPANLNMWYRRMMTPSVCAQWEPDCRVLLHFEAVDWKVSRTVCRVPPSPPPCRLSSPTYPPPQTYTLWRYGDRDHTHGRVTPTKTTVYIGGQFVGGHLGGYDNFWFDITSFIKDNGTAPVELLVGVYDPTTGVKGKQRRSALTDPHGITYTSTSGIWATVWLEAVPVTHIATVVPVPHVDLAGFDFEVEVIGPCAGMNVTVTVSLDSCPSALANSIALLGHPTPEGHGEDDGQWTTITVPLPAECRKRWSPAQPVLYNVTVELVVASSGKVNDLATSYAGLRTYTVGDDGTGTTRPLLNGKFVYQMATLDQGFWPDGNYAAPTDAGLRYDLEAHKEMGFNAVRKHQKVEPRRWYHHADVLGLMVWQDMPCCADSTFPEQITNIVRKRRMHPSVVQWETFNEGGGMSTAAFVGEMVALVRQTDPTRPVDAASGGRDLCHTPPRSFESCGMFGSFDLGLIQAGFLGGARSA